MNKKDFMNKLKELIPGSECTDILNDFEEHFATGLAVGKTEQEIVEALGNPTEIAKDYGYVQDTWRAKASPSTIVMASIGLVFFDLIIGLAIAGALLGVWISLWSVVLSLVISGVAVMFAGAFQGFPWYLGITGGIACLGLALLTGIGMCYVSKYFWKLLVLWAKLHAKVFTGQ